MRNYACAMRTTWPRFLAFLILVAGTAGVLSAWAVDAWMDGDAHALSDLGTPLLLLAFAGVLAISRRTGLSRRFVRR